MATIQAAPQGSSPSAANPVGMRVVGFVLLGCWAALIAAGLLSSHHASTFAQLKADVAAGRVTEVQVSEGLPRRGIGYSVVQVHWRDGLLGYSTSVIEERPRNQSSSTPSVRGFTDVTAVVDQSVPWLLRDLNPDVHVTSLETEGTGVTLLGWTPPTWLAAVVLAVFVATVWLITAAPQPRHATRWGWFWLVLLASPVGAVAYLLLSGVTSATAPPGPTARRLSGGWAFLVAITVGAAIDAAVGAIV